MYVKYKLDPTCQHDLHLCLYKKVKNIQELLIKAKEGVLECALLNPLLVYDPFQVVIAANKAILSLERDSLITRNVYSEIIFNLSPSKNISKSLVTFGIQEQNNYPVEGVDILIAVVKKKDSTEILEDAFSFIQGEQCSIEVIHTLKNITHIEKEYKIHGNDLLKKIITILASK